MLSSHGESRDNYEKILASKTNKDNEKVVLVEMRKPGGTQFEDKEWVTWIVDNSGNRFWGHYFFDKKEAQDDFASRAF